MLDSILTASRASKAEQDAVEWGNEMAELDAQANALEAEAAAEAEAVAAVAASALEETASAAEMFSTSSAARDAEAGGAGPRKGRRRPPFLDGASRGSRYSSFSPASLPRRGWKMKSCSSCRAAFDSGALGAAAKIFWK